jgi:hypothetical protein
LPISRLTAFSCWLSDFCSAGVMWPLLNFDIVRSSWRMADPGCEARGPGLW